MPSTPSIARTPNVAKAATPFILAIAVALAGVATVRAQNGDVSAGFIDAVSDARSATQSAIDEAIAAIDTGCMGLAVDDCLIDVVAVRLPIVVAEYAAYADTLGSLLVPDALADDVSLHIEMLRAASALLEEVVQAAESGDGSHIPDLTDRIATAHADLAERLDPSYGRAAFVSPFVGLPNTPFSSMDFAVLMGSTDEEQAYLDAVRDITQLLVERERCFGGALLGASETTVELLERLSECGAGRTYDAMVEQAPLLEPPPRFADEHAWWLATLEASARHDRASGEAAEGGDLSVFIAEIIRIGLANRPYAGIDPTFGAASQLPGSRLGSAPDPAAPVARSVYGQALFGALVAYWVADPRYHANLPLEFPRLPEEDVLAAVSEAAPDLRAAEDDLRAALIDLDPPPEHAADHDLMLDHFQRDRDRLEAAAESAMAGDMAAVREAWEGGFEDYCATVEGLSEAIRPVSDVSFAGLGCR